MDDAFEDHCWKDLFAPDVLKAYSFYRRDIGVGPAPALLAVDLYELSYQGGPVPVADLLEDYPSSCGENAWAAIEPTKALFAAARQAGLPVFYSTSDHSAHARPGSAGATKRKNRTADAALFEIRADFQPRAGDVVIRKQRASAFFGTPLASHLTQLGVRSLIICGESTSGCVRATAVDAFSHGFKVTLVEECVFDRNQISHRVNLFDLHHKYADVLHIEEVVRHLEQVVVAA